MGVASSVWLRAVVSPLRPGARVVHDDPVARATSFGPLRRVEGYLPLEDYGLIGDGATAALVGRDGAVEWLCAPHFDSPPIFCALLDARFGGAFTIAPEDLIDACQVYLPDTAVLVTELRSRTGRVRITDTLTLRAGADLSEDGPAARGELLRAVTGLDGRVHLRIDVNPYGETRAEPYGDGVRLRLVERPDLDLRLQADVPLDGLCTVRAVGAGDRLHVLLRWGSGASRHRLMDPDCGLEATVAAWRAWMAHLQYEGPHAAQVHRSALTLKLLDHFENGAIVAAPTSSLPEAVGGVRNWDYRYTWVRDAAFSVYALRRIGLHQEAWRFLAWVLDAIETEGRPRILYDLRGRQPPPEREDPALGGYRRSPPVRWGNAAADQRQHDAYGEILDCAYQWVARGGQLDRTLWARLEQLVDAARRDWRRPDHGIWEVRTPGQVFTYSAALCQVALDRGARIAERLGLPGDVAGWRTEADRIRAAILAHAWDPQRQALTEHLDRGALDASLLTLPLRRVIEATHPRMIATTAAVQAHLGAGNGLLYRYRVEESPDGLTGGEGAFVLCSFWLVDNLALQGRLDEAMELYDALCARTSPLGLLPEQIDPGSGAFLGNFPQAFSHVGLITSAVTLARVEQRRGERVEPAATREGEGLR